jgi:hypothetical protein
MRGIMIHNAMKIFVCTNAFNTWYREVVKYGIRNMQNYCDKHSYEFACYTENDKDIYDQSRDIPWYKIKSIEKVLKECPYLDLVVWIDADCQILKSDISLESIIEKYLPQCKDVLISSESDGHMNTGIMFWRNTPYSLTLLNRIWDNQNQFESHFHEQASFNQLLSIDEEVKNKVEILPAYLQPVFNAYWYMYYPGEIFILHCARCSHDLEGLVFMMDMFCPTKLDEENEDQYKDRMTFLNSKEICRAYFDACLSEHNKPSRRWSARAHTIKVPE